MRKTRCEPRTAFSAEVRVYGLDSAGRAVNAVAKTVDISRRGARIAGIEGWEQAGEVIGVRHGQEKARYQIMWIGQPATPQQGEMGLMCVEIGKMIWADALPETKAAAADAGSTTGSFRAAADAGSTTGSFRIAPGSGLIAAQAPNRRRAPRYVVEGGLHVREQGAQAGQWATVHDISIGGCYVETVSPLPLDVGIEASLHIGEFQFQVRGVVVKVDPLTGMAIKFTDISTTHRPRLETLIATLAQQNAPQA